VAQNTLPIAVFCFDKRKALNEGPFKDRAKISVAKDDKKDKLKKVVKKV
jgi:hypothetical protein